MRSLTLCWNTRDGKRIPIREMTDLHLSNALAMLQRGHTCWGCGGSGSPFTIATDGPCGACDGEGRVYDKSKIESLQVEVSRRASLRQNPM